MTKVLFYHGGPGLNGNPERNILLPVYQQHGIELCIWDEPSTLREAENNNYLPVTFDHYITSASDFLLQHYEGEPLTIMGHSFGTSAIAGLLAAHPEKIANAIIVSPAFFVYSGDRNIFNIVKTDLAANGESDKAAAMQIVLDNFADAFDNNTVQGWMIAAVDPRLFNYYWHNDTAKTNYLPYYAPPTYSLDAQSFFAIRQTFQEIAVNNCVVKTLILHGLYDKIIDVAGELGAMPSRFTNATIVEMEASAHYPHIEEADKTLELILNFVKD
ncbi:alpha/beta hydrolase [Chitinophagaceae bacterium 26-R-25]|nr:alpha/beta hydrolase [Chitinophagaceae bacterium 26-R-25]